VGCAIPRDVVSACIGQYTLCFACHMSSTCRPDRGEEAGSEMRFVLICRVENVVERGDGKRSDTVTSFHLQVASFEQAACGMVPFQG
jgi:hypothetical protein